MNGLTVIEHERIAVRPQLDPSSPEKALSVEQVRELELLGARMNARVIEHVSQATVKFRQFVGIVRVGGRDIEILPKIEDPEGDPTLPSLRLNLLRMLLVASNMSMRPAGDTASAPQHATWLDIFIRAFCHDLAKAVRSGLLKRYRVCEDDLQALQGCLVVQEQIRRNLVNRERLACEFDELDEDHALNQLLKLALARMLSITRSSVSQRAVRTLLFAFDAVSDRSPKGDWWQQVAVDRLASRFAPSVRMAQLFLASLSPGLSRGGTDSYALLFDMNILFEEYISRRLRPALQSDGVSVRLQDARHHLMRTEAGTGNIFRLKPDIVISEGSSVVCLGDTKWKRLSLEERKLGVSQADLYQMLGYAHRYGCARTWLLYPYRRDESLSSGPSSDEGHLLRYQGSETTVLVGQVCLAHLETVDAQLRRLFRRAICSPPVT